MTNIITNTFNPAETLENFKAMKLMREYRESIKGN